MSSTAKDIGGAVSPLNINVLRHNARIKRGEYEFEDVDCFCGNSEGEVVTKKDRYGIFYTMKLCPDCGVMYASPRMTEESAKKFYKEDYRGIYDVGDPRGYMSREQDWDTGVEHAEYIKEFLEEFEIEPKVVFDIGCNLGQFLKVYDCETYGVDYDTDSVKYGLEKGVGVMEGGIEALERLNKKADLIILNHVFEHFMDLRENLNRISKLLAKDGYLFIEVPGLYTWQLKNLFQNAHNWQFNTRTLTYVMNSCGWEGMYADAQIKSVWRYTGEVNDDLEPVKGQAKEIWEYKFSGKSILPSIDPVCKFPLKQRRDNVKSTLSYKLKDIDEIHDKYAGIEAIIVSGGPSIGEYREKIKELQAEGKIVVAIERMYQWCQDNGIIPDVVLVMDASDDVIESFDKIHPCTTHILATQCNEDIFKRLKDENTYIYSSAQSHVNFGDAWLENDYKRVTLLNTGSSVSLGCMAISMFLGMKVHHIFGFDCHMNEKNYADGITGTGDIKDKIEVVVDEVDYVTTVCHVSFARQFFGIFQLGKANNLLDGVYIYGDSLIKALSKIKLEPEGK